MSRRLDRSRQLQKRAEALIPGGVNSPVRAFRAVGSEPPIIDRGEGARVYDVDGNSYIDYVLSWGPLILGHAFTPVINAIEKAAEHGTSFGASTPSEADLAEAVVHAMPAIEKLRFVSSGTEATMSAIRLARGFTERKYIVKFEGCYHGHVDSLLVKAGSGVATLGIPGSAGVPDELAQLTLALPYNNVAAVEAGVQEVQATRSRASSWSRLSATWAAFRLRLDISKRSARLRRAIGALLIVDEVMTGFRVAYGGAQQLYGLEPDLVTLGKIIGGGLPVAAYGGRAEIMDKIAPLGPVYQAGTLSGNPLAMAAGLAMLCHLRDNQMEIYPRLDQLSADLVNRVLDAAREAGVSLTANRVGSMFTWFFTDRKVTDWDSAATCDTKKFGRFHGAMLDAGVWLPPAQFEAAFLSAAHTEQDIEDTVAAAREAFAALAD